MNGQQSAVSSQKEQTTTALQQVKSSGHLAKPAQLSLGEMRELGDIFFASGMFQDVKNVSQAIVKIKAGEELGFTPFVSMGGVHVIQGKPSLGATLQASLLKDSPRYRYETKSISNEECTLLFFEKFDGQWKQVGESTFTMADAKSAKLADKDVWKQYPRNMLFARALTNGMRWYTPDLLRCADGYSEGNADFDVDEVINDTAEPEAAAAAAVDYVDGQIVEDDPAEIPMNPEELRQAKVDHVQQLCRSLNENKDSIEWKASSLASYINQMFDVDDGLRSLEFESLDKLISNLTDRLTALKDKPAAE